MVFLPTVIGVVLSASLVLGRRIEPPSQNLKSLEIFLVQGFGWNSMLER
jgi:hypothetical protein